MAAWAFDDSTALNDRCIMQCQDTSASTRYFRLSVGNDFISVPTALPCQIAVSASGANANDTASRTSAERVTNRWHHWAGVYAGDASRTAYLDGVVGTENTFTADPFADSTLDSISVGSEQDSSPGDEWSGGILWPAIWNVVLTAEEIGLLARGAHPTTIRPQNLVFFASLDDTPEGLRDLISGKMANFDSNATQAAHGTPLPTRDPMLYRAIPKLNLPVAHSAGPAITFVPTSGDSGVATASNTNGQNLDITIDISDGADLLIILNVAWGQTTISLEDWVTTTEPFALLDGTQVAEIFPNLGGDVSIRAYGVVNPTAKVETITATVGGDLNTNYHLMAAVAYKGVDTSSLNAAAKVRWLANNNVTTTTTTIFPERGSANNKMLALCGALGFTSTTPTVTNDGGFTERARFASDAGVGNADGTIYIAEGGAPSPLTVTWPGQDENGGFYVELINAANVSAALGPFLVKRPWTRQPPPGTRIDNSNPLAKNLTRFVTFYMGGVGYDAFNNEQPIPNTAYQGVIGTLEGTASSHPLTTGSAELELVERPRYETGMQSSGFTFMSKARNKVDGALANQEFVAGMFGGGAGGNPWAWRLTVSGTPTFSIYTDGGTTNNSSAPLPTGYDARDWHTFGGIMDYPNSTCYVDYTPDSTPVDLTGLTVDDVGAGGAMHIGAGGSATSSWNGEILYCATWKRALSQAEWDSMVANPWQIFEPEKVLVAIEITPAGVVITDVANSGETPGAGSESWDDGSTGNVITGTGFL